MSRYEENGVVWIDGFIKDNKSDCDLTTIKEVVDKLNEQEELIFEQAIQLDYLQNENKHMKDVLDENKQAREQIRELEKENIELQSIRKFAEKNGICIFNIDEAFRKCWKDNEELKKENYMLASRNQELKINNELYDAENEQLKIKNKGLQSELQIFKEDVKNSNSTINHLTDENKQLEKEKEFWKSDAVQSINLHSMLSFEIQKLTETKDIDSFLDFYYKYFCKSNDDMELVIDILNLNEQLKKSIKRQQLSNEKCSKYIEEVVKENKQLKKDVKYWKQVANQYSNEINIFKLKKQYKTECKDIYYNDD